MLTAIGETFDPALSSAVAAAAADARDGTSTAPASPPKSIITGVIVSARPSFYRLSIWTRLAPSSSPSPNADSTHASETGEPLRERIESIGKQFKIHILGYAENQKLAGQLSTDVEFQSHKDSERKPKGAKKWII